MAAARMAATSRPAMPMGISRTMKVGKMRSELAKRCGVLSVEDEEAYADEEEERELDEDDDAGAEQGEARFAQVAGGEHALDHELVGAVRGHGEEGSAEDAGPEGVGGGEVEGEVEHVELAGGAGDVMDRGPAAGDVVSRA